MIELDEGRETGVFVYYEVNFLECEGFRDASNTDFVRSDLCSLEVRWVGLHA